MSDNKKFTVLMNAFFDLSHVAPDQLVAYAQRIRAHILQATGIPVRLGLAPSRVLAKVAVQVAKDDLASGDVVTLVNMSEQELDAILATIDVRDIWGIGKQFARKLEKEYIFTAEVFKYLPPGRARKLLGVVGERIVLELKGIRVFRWNRTQSRRKRYSCLDPLKGPSSVVKNWPRRLPAIQRKRSAARAGRGSMPHLSGALCNRTS